MKKRLKYAMGIALALVLTVTGYIVAHENYPHKLVYKDEYWVDHYFLRSWTGACYEHTWWAHGEYLRHYGANGTIIEDEYIQTLSQAHDHVRTADSSECEAAGV